jgi:hypothetical protein
MFYVLLALCFLGSEIKDITKRGVTNVMEIATAELSSGGSASENEALPPLVLRIASPFKMGQDTIRALRYEARSVLGGGEDDQEGARFSQVEVTVMSTPPITLCMAAASIDYAKMITESALDAFPDLQQLAPQEPDPDALPASSPLSASAASPISDQPATSPDAHHAPPRPRQFSRQAHRKPAVSCPLAISYGIQNVGGTRFAFVWAAVRLAKSQVRLVVFPFPPPPLPGFSLNAQIKCPNQMPE